MLGLLGDADEDGVEDGDADADGDDDGHGHGRVDCGGLGGRGVSVFGGRGGVPWCLHRFVLLHLGLTKWFNFGILVVMIVLRMSRSTWS